MYKRINLAKYGRLLHEAKMVIGTGGNISEKDGDFLIIKKKGADMSESKPEDYIRLPFSEAAEGKNSLLSSEAPLHVACYNANEKVGAIIHVHSPYIIAAANRTGLLESPSYEFDCLLVNAVPVVGYLKPGSQYLADAVAHNIRSKVNAVMLKQHGAISIGGTIEEAYYRILALERACMIFLLNNIPDLSIFKNL
ncbi:MAG: class II aldolase/adducin family protein [Candidatus Omnitrophota bacterium]